MNCEKCNPACSLPICADNIFIGRIAFPNTNVWLVITELITGRKQTVEVLSDNSGNIIVGVTGFKPFFSPNFIYSFAIYSNLSNGCPDIDLFIGNITVSCIDVTFFVCTDANVTTSTIKLQSEIDTIDDDQGNPIQDDSYNFINP